MLKHFTGGFTYKVDASGRVSLPAEFRRVLDAQGSAGFIYILPQMDDDRCHAAFSLRGYDNLVERHYQTEYADDDEQMDMEARLLENARQVPVDDAGRIVLTDTERKAIGIVKDVRFVGLGASFEIWEPTARQSAKSALRARRDTQVRRIDRRGLHG